MVSKLAGDEFEVALDQSEIGSRLVGPSQREDVLSGMAHVMAERGYPSVKPLGRRRVARRERQHASIAPIDLNAERAILTIDPVQVV